MREAHDRERATGVEWYVSDADGTGGRLRATPEDFRVRELEAFDYEPLDADPGSYAHLVFRATLRAWDTNDFAGALASKLGISRERVSWAGTKDKRAVTTQLFSVEGIEDADALPELDEADIEPLGRAGRPVLFGDLAGNAFDITVSAPDAPGNADAITEQLRGFAGHEPSEGGVGVPNFFGPQRFGASRPVTHEVGLALLRGDPEAAVWQYVCATSETEPEASSEARAAVADGWGSDWGELTERLPGRLRYERSLLQGLAESDAAGEERFRDALERLPSNLRRLFVHAAQSYAFNRMLSARLERGLPFDAAVAGDVVCFADRDAPEGLPLPDPDRTQRVTEGRVDTVNRHVERGRAFVTAPLVGTDTDLADGEQGEIERAVLDDMDLAPDDFALPGEFASSGTRRAILLTSDLDASTDPLSFSFRLPKGSYATTLLREYLKTDPGSLA
ncbi:tRNA pseudouridine(13) synthase TruD [Halosegnis marinus]|uniref:Probable tRNA pseudouridine synthase D n=1 Tax=Halosegnis marinus TaxID=3034023 RepID=A0ABD5ZM05_9EURY|nr:tRNA pseudouridine(13) synthase TruD [Halosegnis sp. DT85]